MARQILGKATTDALQPSMLHIKFASWTLIKRKI
jgi:hypothetical protein